MHALKDKCGHWSSMRILNWFVAVVFMMVWAITSYKSGMLQPISAEQVVLIIGVSGTKALQSFAEHKGGTK